MTPVEWPGSAASEYSHVDEIARLTRERDAAIAQRDRAVGALRPFAELGQRFEMRRREWCEGLGMPYEPLNPDDVCGVMSVGELRNAAAAIADTPVPDRLAAEREAEQQHTQRVEELLILARPLLVTHRSWKSAPLVEKIDEALKVNWDKVETDHLRDTPAAPVEGGET